MLYLVCAAFCFVCAYMSVCVCALVIPIGATVASAWTGGVAAITNSAVDQCAGDATLVVITRVLSPVTRGPAHPVLCLSRRSATAKQR